MPEDFTFKAIGTTWCISVSEGSLTTHEQETIRAQIAEFEKQFSRFLPDSEVNSFRGAKSGDYSISPEFAVLLTMADRLRTVTNGVYDPAVSTLLERAGYDASYRLTPSDDLETFSLPHWSLAGTTLHIDGPIAFDLGGIGKGYCIDKVSTLLKQMNYSHFLVDAGGDIYATTKSDGAPWRIAIQYPGKPEIAAGIVDLHDQAIAVSDSFRRRWGAWHHIVNPQTKTAIERVVGAVAVTANAWFADCMTSILFLAPQETYAQSAKEFGSQYLVFLDDGTSLVSSDWRGELF